jgi:hypothetical protein
MRDATTGIQLEKVAFNALLPLLIGDNDDDNNAAGSWKN